jgi:dienelactone hydrolase
VVASLVAVLAGCSDGGPAHRSDRAEATGTGPAQRAAAARCRALARTNPSPGAGRSDAAGVTRITLMLVDPRRPTPAIPHRPASPCRVLPTELRYPTAVTRPVPLIVVAHGLDGSPSSLAPLLDAWARAGYAVAAPTFPTTRKDSHGASLASEPVDQAADMRFVIGQLVGRSRTAAASPLTGLIDGTRIGAAGMSLGGLGVYGLVSNTCCRDTRVRAAILMAAVRREFPDERYEDNRAPVLLVQGDADSGYHNSVEAYPELVPPKWFITLHGSGHSPPFEVPPGPEAPLVYTTTTLFWDRYLKGTTAAADQIADAVRASHGRATLQRDLG